MEEELRLKGKAYEGVFKAEKVPADNADSSYQYKGRVKIVSKDREVPIEVSFETRPQRADMPLESHLTKLLPGSTTREGKLLKVKEIDSLLDGFYNQSEP